jgi:hypothetical protein
MMLRRNQTKPKRRTMSKVHIVEVTEEQAKAINCELESASVLVPSEPMARGLYDAIQRIASLWGEIRKTVKADG